jgi:hypothetical protein
MNELQSLMIRDNLKNIGNVADWIDFEKIPYETLMQQEQVLWQFCEAIEMSYSQSIIVDKPVLNKHIKEFWDGRDKLRIEIDNANKAIVDAKKHKLQFYKEAYQVLLRDL